MKKVIIKFLVGILFVPLSLSAQKTMEVFGVGKLELKADYTIVEITVGSEKTQYDTLLSLINQNTKQIEKLLLTSGFDKTQINITDLHLDDYGMPTFGEPNYTGWRNIIVEFEFDKSLTEELLKNLSNHQSEPYFRVYFGLTDSKKDVTRDKLIELALQDAKRKADAIANAYNLKISGIQKIQYGNVSFDSDVKAHSVDLITGMMTPSYQKYPMDSPEVEFMESVLVIWEFEE
jgi:uncharacterized protein YggE